MAELFRGLQRSIESLYRLENLEDVGQFCLAREHLEFFLGQAAERTREVLLVKEAGEFTDVGLYVAEEVRQRAEQFLEVHISGPSGALEHIDQFCVALEGVSHFVYLTFCGNAQERPVSRIELELQAELDKFLFLRLTYPHPELVERLFVQVHIDPTLDGLEVERYELANQRALRYAKWLDRQIDRGRAASALEDARRLYRKPLSEKLEHINRAA
jgi:hypothetical protein